MLIKPTKKITPTNIVLNILNLWRCKHRKVSWLKDNFCFFFISIFLSPECFSQCLYGELEWHLYFSYKLSKTHSIFFKWRKLNQNTCDFDSWIFKCSFCLNLKILRLLCCTQMAHGYGLFKFSNDNRSCLVLSVMICGSSSSVLDDLISG